MARSFNGSTDYITLPGALSVGIPLTCSAWINLTAITGASQAIFWQEAGANSWGTFITATTGTFQFEKGAVIDIDSLIVCSTGVWTHLVWELLGSDNSASLWVNGVFKGNFAQLSALASTARSNQIGSQQSPPNSLFGGSIAECAVWNVNLTAAEIGALAIGARPNTIRPTNLAFWAPLDGLASPEPDLSGYKNNGTLTGTALASGPPIMPFTPRWPQNYPFASAAAGASFQPAWAARQRIIIEGIGI